MQEIEMLLRVAMLCTLGVLWLALIYLTQFATTFSPGGFEANALSLALTAGLLRLAWLSAQPSPPTTR